MTAAVAPQSPQISTLSVEEKRWIEKRLGLLDGVKSDPVFRERVRAHLQAHQLANEIVWRGGGNAETWKQAFARWFKEPL